MTLYSIGIVAKHYGVSPGKAPFDVGLRKAFLP